MILRERPAILLVSIFWMMMMIMMMFTVRRALAARPQQQHDVSLLLFARRSCSTRTQAATAAFVPPKQERRRRQQNNENLSLISFARQQSSFDAVRATSRCIVVSRRSITTTTTTTSFPPSSFSLSATNNESNNNDDGINNNSFFANMDWKTLGVQSEILLERLATVLQLERPTAVQAAAFCEISSSRSRSSETTNKNVLVGAETGTGKTLAFLVPLLDDILEQKRLRVKEQHQQQQHEQEKSSEYADEQQPEQAQQQYSQLLVDYDYARAVILVPNKELVQQMVRMALPLAGGMEALVYGGNTLPHETLKSLQKDTYNNINHSASPPPPPHEVVRIAIMPGGLKEPSDFPPFRASIGLGGNDPPVDVVITTPASLGPLGLSPKNIDMFADIETVVIDEADMLLDGGYLRPLENVLLGFRRADRLNADGDGSGGLLGNIKKTQHVLVAATIPDYGLRSADAYLQKKFPQATRVTMTGMHNARHYRLTEQTEWILQESRKERMMKLIDLLQTPIDQGGLKGEKIMVFLNSVDDAEAASQALIREGMSVLPYHAKIKLEDRTLTLDRFRRYQSVSSTNSSNSGIDAAVNAEDDSVPILVCTDLASRGLDVPGVNAVVQLQFAGNVVAHLHRMGRCGRAGQRKGRGIVFYDKTEAELVQVIQAAEEQQERMVLEGDVLDIESKDNESSTPAAAAGSVEKAFSRKRGFTKKRKKMQRERKSS